MNPLYDFSALTEPLTAEDLQVYDTAKMNEKPRWLKIVEGVSVSVGVVILLVILIGATWAILATEGTELQTIGTIGVLLFVSLAGYLVYKTRAGRRMDARLLKFVTQNHAEYIRTQVPYGYNGLIFDNGRLPVITRAVRFSEGLEMGNFQYTTGEGKTEHTHTVGYARMKLSKMLPHMVLDAKANDLFGFSSLPDQFKRNQALSLEGNFDTYFRLYVPKQYERDALYIFTPNVMETVIKYGAKYDIEIVDNDLYIYNPKGFNLTDAIQWQNVLTLIAKFGGAVVRQSQLYVDQRANMVGVNVIGVGGKRLKQRVPVWAIVFVIGIIGVYTYTIAASDAQSLAAVLPLATWLIIVVVGVVISHLRKR